MKRMKPLIGWLFFLLSVALMTAPPSPAAETPAMVVGRIYHIEGDLLRYVPEENDWVAMVRDAPFGVGDTLFSGSSGMAELIVPNGIWVRTGNSTQLQFITLDADLAEMDVASGMARFYSKGRATVKVTSPFGYVQADPGTIFDLYVGENSVEAVAIKGTVSFVHPATDGRYDVAAGATSILADPQQVSSGDGTVDSDWNRWNRNRENFWLAKNRVTGPSVEYLPPELRQEAYVFEENGRWERIPYEGEARWFWRPTTVAVGWSPFTVGRWTNWYGDQTWIPAEPFGYATHHYGNWIYAGNHWYWAPPVASVRVGTPLLSIGFFWSPGRVAWIHSGVHVGWVPLAPRETYYCRRPWGGPHTVVVNNINVNQITVNHGRHAYVDRAIIVNQNDFHGRDNYRNVRVTNINRTTIINNYRTAPVVNNTVINNYSTNRQRHNFTNVPVQEKPHNTVTNRIRDNEKIIHEGKKENAAALQERLKAAPEGRVKRDARVEQPRGTDHIVPAGEINRPKAELKLPQREIKGGGIRGVPLAEPGRSVKPAERAAPARPAPPEPVAPRPERAAPASPGQPAPQTQPAKPAERVAPARPPQPPQPAVPADRMIPARPAQPEQAAPKAERGAPASPGQSVPVTPRTERVAPARPPQPPQSTAPADRVIPARPAQPEQAAPKAERGAPASPGQSAPVTPRTERVAPAKPAPPEPVAPRPERTAPASPGQSEPQTQPVKPAERVAPARPVQPEPPAKPSERVIPARPPQPPQSTAPADRVIPARPAQPEQAAPRPERAIPASPGQSAPQTQPVKPAERVAPARPPQPPQPAVPAERAAPTRPAQPEPVTPRTERAAPAKPVQPEQVRPEQTASQPEPAEQKQGRQQPNDPRRPTPDRK